MSEGYQSFRGPHPVYYAKWLASQRPIYTNHIQAQPYTPIPVSPPTEPIINPEMRMRMIQANTRINPDGVKAVYVPPTPIHNTGVQPTNPEIIERLTAYGELGDRKWYASPWIPYVGWPRRELQSGIQV
jgi:hypothetical protein